MTESSPTTPRWRGRLLFVTAGALGAGVVAASLILASAGHQPPVTATVRLAAVTTSGAAGADQAAVRYVDTHYPGSGTARVQKTESDVERGVPVYDVRVTAPDGTTYVVHVRRSNDAVLSANPAEQQVSVSPATDTTAPPETTPLVPTPPVTTAPQPAETSEPSETSEPAETSEPPATTAPGTDSPDHATDQSPDQSGTSSDQQSSGQSSDQSGTSSDQQSSGQSSDQSGTSSDQQTSTTKGNDN